MENHNSKPKSALSFLFDRSFSLNSAKRSDLDRFQSPKKPNKEGNVTKLCNSFEAALTKRLSNQNPIFRRALSSKQYVASSSKLSPIFNKGVQLPGTEDRIVVYFTSLRGIRRTYEDCYSVRMILRGFRVPVDERDISMDSAYRKELLTVLGEKTVSLPKVFIRGRYVGGAEEVKQLHEVGDLVKLLKGFPVREVGNVCESCGDARFVPCLNCRGSRKVFCEEEDVTRRCGVCNENGLIRCPKCCY